MKHLVKVSWNYGEFDSSRAHTGRPSCKCARCEGYEYLQGLLERGSIIVSKRDGALEFPDRALAEAAIESARRGLKKLRGDDAYDGHVFEVVEEPDGVPGDPTTAP